MTNTRGYRTPGELAFPDVPEWMDNLAQDVAQDVDGVEAVAVKASAIAVKASATALKASAAAGQSTAALALINGADLAATVATVNAVAAQAAASAAGAIGSTVDAVTAVLEDSGNAASAALKAIYVRKDRIYLNDYLNPSRTPGVTDDTSAFMAAKAAMTAGSILVISPGPYRVSDVVEFTLDGIAIEAMGAVIDLVDDGTGEGRNFRANGCDGFTWTGGTLAQSAAARTGVYGLLSLFDVDNATLARLTTRGGSSTGIFAQGGSHHHYDHPKVFDAKADGIHISRGITDVTIDNAHVVRAGDDGIGVIAVLADGGTTYGQVQRVAVNNPIIRGSSPIGNGVTFIGSKLCTLTGGVITDLANDGVKVSVDDVAGATTRPSGITITGTVAERCERGFSFGPSDSITVTGAQGINNRDIGIAMIGSAKTHVVGGSFTGNAGFGAYIDSSDGVNFIGSDLRGNALAPHQSSNGLTVGFLNCITT